ncbi:MAG: hypothetical protein M0Z32_08015 [Actinomycetota bacterium]|nr:hypothetical protein [Actinomycetota bacterium]MCL6092215.1 hypothetical protein [Actinomycetota bacterium]MDA8167671.1 hypothetical protein [Actinomycetota bacterium]
MAAVVTELPAAPAVAPPGAASGMSARAPAAPPKKLCHHWLLQPEEFVADSSIFMSYLLILGHFVNGIVLAAALVLEINGLE